MHKYTTLGEGVEEYEVGFWATRHISKGEEVRLGPALDAHRGSLLTSLPADSFSTTTTCATALLIAPRASSEANLRIYLAV